MRKLCPAYSLSGRPNLTRTFLISHTNYCFVKALVAEVMKNGPGWLPRVAA